MGLPLPFLATWKSSRLPRPVKMVNIPKTKKAFCKSKECRKHTVHKVTQYMLARPLCTPRVRGVTTASIPDSVVRPSLFHKKAKTTKKIVLLSLAAPASRCTCTPSSLQALRDRWRQEEQGRHVLSS